MSDDDTVLADAPLQHMEVDRAPANPAADFSDDDDGFGDFEDADWEAAPTTSEPEQLTQPSLAPVAVPEPAAAAAASDLLTLDGPGFLQAAAAAMSKFAPLKSSNTTTSNVSTLADLQSRYSQLKAPRKSGTGSSSVLNWNGSPSQARLLHRLGLGPAPSQEARLTAPPPARRVPSTGISSASLAAASAAVLATPVAAKKLSNKPFTLGRPPSSKALQPPAAVPAPAPVVVAPLLAAPAAIVLQEPESIVEDSSTSAIEQPAAPAVDTEKFDVSFGDFAGGEDEGSSMAVAVDSAAVGEDGAVNSATALDSNGGGGGDGWVNPFETPLEQESTAVPLEGDLVSESAVAVLEPAKVEESIENAGGTAMEDFGAFEEPEVGAVVAEDAIDKEEDDDFDDFAAAEELSLPVGAAVEDNNIIAEVVVVQKEEELEEQIPLESNEDGWINPFDVEPSQEAVVASLDNVVGTEGAEGDANVDTIDEVTMAVAAVELERDSEEIGQFKGAEESAMEDVVPVEPSAAEASPPLEEKEEQQQEEETAVNSNDNDGWDDGFGDDEWHAAPAVEEPEPQEVVAKVEEVQDEAAVDGSDAFQQPDIAIESKTEEIGLAFGEDADANWLSAEGDGNAPALDTEIDAMPAEQIEANTKAGDDFDDFAEFEAEADVTVPEPAAIAVDQDGSRNADIPVAVFEEPAAPVVDDLAADKHANGESNPPLDDQDDDFDDFCEADAVPEETLEQKAAVVAEGIASQMPDLSFMLSE